jgi:methyl-accepting chemotaxis protein
MIRDRLLSRKFFVGVIFLLFILLFTFLIINGYFNFSSHEKMYISAAKDMIDQRMRSLLFEMNVFPQYIGNELLFLSKLSSLRGILDPQEHDCQGDLQEDFLKFMQGSVSYYQLRYIDENGDEIVRINYDGVEYRMVPDDELRNKGNRYYFNETMRLSEGQIYLSDLDLNIEGGELENRGTIADPIYVPVLRVATPVFKNNGERGGIILLNIYADYFLNDIRRFQRDNEKVFLVNNQGYYLSHPDKKKEFSFMFGGDDRFFDDYPEIPREKVLEVDGRILETDSEIFFFQYVYPTVGDVGLINDSDSAVASKEDYYWVLVSVSDKRAAYKFVSNLRNDYFSFLVFSGIIILIIISVILIFVFGVPIPSRRRI